MRRAAITKLTIDHLAPERRALSVEEKGGYSHTYAISREGWQAIEDYLEHERDKDVARGPSLALFLPASTVAHSTGRLAVLAINEIWKAVCLRAQVEGKTPTVLGMPWVNISWRKRAILRRSSANLATAMPLIPCSTLG